jgi:septal ring factor EnvC (AmiA/AmiB activator)
MFVADSLLILCLILMGAMSGAMISMVRFILRQRTGFINALQQSTDQNIKTAQQLANAITSLQRQQQQHNEQLQSLANAFVRLRQDMPPVNKRTEAKADKDIAANDEPPRILH